MFRKVNDGNISDEEFLSYGSTHTPKCWRALEECVIPKYVAFYIAVGYYDSSLWESSFSQHFNSAIDIFNIKLKNQNKVIRETKRILKTIYSLEIVEESPILKVRELSSQKK